MKSAKWSLLLLFLLLGACTNSKEKVGALYGLYDGHGYTAPFGALSIDCRDWVRLSSLIDEKANDGAVYKVDFDDQEGNHYALRLSFVDEQTDGEKMIDQLVEKAKLDKKMVLKSLTPEGQSCLVYATQRKAKDQKMGYGMMNVIFYKKGLVFNLVIKTHAVDTSKEAAELSDVVISRLWNHCFFRGYTAMAKSLQHPDPRMAVAVSAAEQVASQLKVSFEFDNGREPVVKLVQSEELQLAMKIYIKNFQLYTQEGVSSSAPAVAIKVFQSSFYKQFYDIMRKEKVVITRNEKIDQRLLSDFGLKKNN